MTHTAVPTQAALMLPTLTALQALGGSGSIEEIEAQVVTSEAISEEVLAVPHVNGRQSEVEYRLAWARTYLHHAGLVSNPSRGVWALTGSAAKILGEPEAQQVVEALHEETQRGNRQETAATAKRTPPRASTSQEPWPPPGTPIDPAPAELRALGREYLRSMREGDSVFTPGRPVWTRANADALVTAFVDQPDTGARSFQEKLGDQLKGVSDAAIQLFAELWFASLAPLADYMPTTKERLITGILDKMARPVQLPDLVLDALPIEAFAGGVAFKTRRPFQLWLLVRVAVAVTSLDPEARAVALSEPRRWKALLDSVTEPNEPAQRRALSWLLHPDYFLSVVGSKHRAAIRNAFSHLLDGNAIDEDDELAQIRDELEKQGAGTSWYAPPLVDQWDPDRTISGVPISPELLPNRREFKTRGYAAASAAVNLVPEGRWSTYTDIAELAGLTPGQVGQYLREVEHPAGHRVLRIDGSTTNDEKRQAVVAEGLEFDEKGLADPGRRISQEELREELDAQGHLPRVAKRAWLVRGSSVNGTDLVPRWRETGNVSLSASSLRETVPGTSRAELKAIVDDDYAHASYAVRGEKLDDFHSFLTRMEPGHLIATVDQGRLYVGTLIGEARYVPSPDSSANLVRDVDWASGDGIDYTDLPAELVAKLKIQRDVLDLTRELETLEGLLETEVEQAPPPVFERVSLPPATSALANDLHVSQAWLQECVDLLNDRPQLIFYGPPGTGKTFIAQALAKHVAGENIRLVQFHPAYSYEDFFEGYRPTETGGFALRPGPMRKIVEQARDHPREPFVLIIDEINRGNLAKVFGELYFLLEYRDENVELLYADEEFNLPENVFIIGTMNTADRSIALVDSAMRRRFAFLSLHPSEEPTNGILRSWLADQGLPERTAALLDELNRRIEDPDFRIGPSYFMREAVHSSSAGLERMWRTSILPVLEEHHFGELNAAGVRTRYGLDTVAKVVDRPATDEGTEDAAPTSP